MDLNYYLEEIVITLAASAKCLNIQDFEPQCLQIKNFRVLLIYTNLCQCATLLVFQDAYIRNICLKWYLIWISESWKHQNCLEIRRMPTCTYLIETRWQKSSVSCQKGCDSTSSVHCRRGHFLLFLWNASIDYISQITVKHLEKPAQHLHFYHVEMQFTFTTLLMRHELVYLSSSCQKVQLWRRVYFFTNDFFTTQSGVLSCVPFSLWIVNVREEIVVNWKGFNSTATSVSEGLWTDGGFFILPAIFYFLSPPFFALLTLKPSPPFLSSLFFPYLPVEFKALTKTSGKWRENLNTLNFVPYMKSIPLQLLGK